MVFLKKYGITLLFLFVAFIWGGGFVAQKLGMDYGIGPYLYNGLRFLLASIALLPLFLFNRTKYSHNRKLKDVLVYGFIAGVVLAVGGMFQQIGIIYTSAGRAGFISSYYLIWVMIISLVWGVRLKRLEVIGIILAVIGFLLIELPLGKEGFKNFLHSGSLKGDILVMFSSIVYAIHIILLHFITRKVSPIDLSFYQFLVCGILTFVAGLFFDPRPLFGFSFNGWSTILYGGLISVGVGYTLQVVGQRFSSPNHAALVLNLEGLFAALLGLFFFKGDGNLNTFGWIGGGLLLLAVFLSTRAQEDKK